MKRIVIFSAIGILAAALLLGCSDDSTQAHTGPGSRQATVERPSFSSGDETAEPAERGGWGGQASREATSQGANAQSGISAEAVEAAETYSGTLAYKDPEWYLDTGNEVILLHLGNRTFLETIGDDLQIGAEATADGVMEEDGLEVSKLTVNENTLVLRDSDGRPAWSGSGGRSVETTDDSSASRGQGRGRSAGARGRSVESTGSETTGRGNIVYEDERYHL